MVLLLGNKTGKLIDDAVHVLALDQLRDDHKGFLDMVVGEERAGIGAMVHNHTTHVTAVAGHELPCGLAARHDGHATHEQRQHNVVPAF